MTTGNINTDLAVIAAGSATAAAARAAESAQAAADHQEEVARIVRERALRGPTKALREDTQECRAALHHEQVTAAVALADARRFAADALGHHCQAIDAEERYRSMSGDAWEQAKYDVERAEMYAASVAGYLDAVMVMTRGIA